MRYINSLPLPLEIIFSHKISGTPWRIGVPVATRLPPIFPTQFHVRHGVLAYS